MKKLIFSNLTYYAFVFLFMLIYFGGSYFVDFYWRPWAYNRDPNAKLFVGKWAGQFQDPDGVSKTMTLEIFTPFTTAERFGSSLNCGGKTHGKSRKSFEGVATVKSKLGEENYEIWGYFNDHDFHSFYFYERVKQPLSVANFYLKQTPPDCIWKGDELTIVLPFYYQKLDGAGFYSSDDPRFEYQATVLMKRQ